jgi:Bacterial SH3 domain
MSLAGLFKFFTGFVLAIALLFFAGVTATRYVMTRLTTPPPRPTFPNDSPTAAQPPPANASQTSPAAAAPPLEPGAYEARVTEPIGLVLREGPSRETERLGGLDYNEEVIVLETSSDKEWIHVRLKDSDIEGWVKAGNTEPVQ